MKIIDDELEGVAGGGAVNVIGGAHNCIWLIFLYQPDRAPTF